MIYCTDIGEHCPVLGYRRTRVCERLSVSQQGTLFTDISVITTLLYRYKYCVPLTVVYRLK